MPSTLKSGLRRPRLALPASLSDRQLNRLILTTIAVVLVGAAVIAVVYVLDRRAESGPTLVERRVGELESAVRGKPNSVSLRLQLAGAYSAAKRYDDAIVQLGEVLRVEPDNKTALVTRGDLYLGKSRLDEAAADYRKVISIAGTGEFAAVDTELHQAYFSLGSILLKQGKTKEAAQALEAALVIKKTDADTLHLLGRSYLAEGDAAKAVDVLRQAVLFVPVGWGEPYKALQEAYTALGKAGEASWAGAMAAFAAGNLPAAREALAPLTAGDAAVDAYVGLGLVDERLGDVSAARADYDHALALDPQNFTALSGRGRVAAPVASPAAQAGG